MTEYSRPEFWNYCQLRGMAESKVGFLMALYTLEFCEDPDYYQKCLIRLIRYLSQTLVHIRSL